jgi:nucleotide-binding universal stress UspA family protein
MTGFKSILVATDFSTDARHAAERAAMICAETGITRGAVLHVLESSWLENLKHFVSLPAESEQAMVAHAARSLEQLVAATRKRSAFALGAKVVVGSVMAAILEAAGDFDLLALGARGTHPLRRFVVGTTAERLVRQTPKPVLVVRRAPAGAYRRVLVAVDFSPHSRTAFAHSNVIAPHAEIHLVHVFGAPFEGRMLEAGIAEEVVREYRVKAEREAEAEMHRFIEATAVDTRHLHSTVVYGDHAPTALKEKAAEIDADLVVVGKHGKSLGEQLLLGSVTLHMLSECPCDVLVTQ